MKNYVQLGDNLTLPAPYAVVSGAPALIGAVVGIASTDAAINEEVSFVRVGVFNPLPKVAGSAWVAGTTKIYFDAAAKAFTATAGGVLCGVAAAAAASADVTGSVLLTGQIAA
jgi:predicted RecA/RadA family phage recombinase